MRPFTVTLAAAIASVAMVSVSVVNAEPKFVTRVPNGANVNGIAALGHVNPEGDGALNAFGKAFDKAGKKWTKELCLADSDDDGQTNGQELGDPCCEWTAGGTPSFTKGVSHPGDKKMTADPTLWASIKCASGGATASNSSSSSTTPATTTQAPTKSPAINATPSIVAIAVGLSVAIAMAAQWE